MDIKEENPKLPVLMINDFDDCTKDPHFRLVDGSWIKSCRFDDLRKKIGEVLQRKQKS